MADDNKKIEPSALTKRVVTLTQHLVRHRYRMAPVAEQSQPVDCKALLDLIQAAQSVYAEHCPIA